MRNTILETKLKPPNCARMLKRERLLGPIAANGDIRLLSISADAGYGKTVLLAQLYGHLSAPHVWYHLDQSDRDVRFMLLHLIAGVNRQVPGFDIPDFNTDGNVTAAENDPDILLHVFISEFARQVKTPFNLFFDDLQAIGNDSAAIAAIQKMVDSLPDGVAFYIAGKTRPPLTLSRLRTMDSLREIGADDLRFNAAEMEEFLSGGSRPGIMPGMLEDLVAKTEGWPAALALVRNQLHHPGAREQSGIVAAVFRDIKEYLADELWAGLDAELKGILVQNSLLDVIEPDVCSDIGGAGLTTERARELLEEAERLNILVSRIGDTEKYRVHPLFREFLEEQLSTIIDQDAIRDRHQRYTELFSRREMPEAAARHFIGAGMTGELVELVETIGDDMLRAGRVLTLASWLEQIPAEVLEQHPWLCYLKSRTVDSGKQLEDAARLLAIARDGFQDAGDRHGCYLVALASNELLITRNLVSDAVEALVEAIEFAGSLAEKMYALNRLALNYMLIGHPDFAMSLWDEARELCDREDATSRIQIDSSMTSAKYFIGDFTGILELTRDLVENFSPAVPAVNRFIILTIRAAALFETGRYAEAEVLLARSGELLGEEYPIRERYIDILKARVMLYRGQGRRARKITADIIDNCDNNSLLGPEVPLVYIGNVDRRKRKFAKALAEHREALTLCDRHRVYTLATCLVNIGADKARLGNGGKDDGEVDLGAAEALAVKSRANYVLAQVNFHRAWRRLSLGRKDAALRDIRRALSAAAHYGYDHFVVQEGMISLKLLAFAFANGVERDYLLGVFSQIGSRSLSALAPLMQAQDPATREDAVRALAAAGGLSAVPRIQRLLRDSSSQVRSVARQSLDAIRESAVRPEDILTRREFEVLEMVAEGATNPEIAERLVISQPTVKSHVSSIYRKLSVSTRVQAAMYYNQHVPHDDEGNSRIDLFMAERSTNG